MKKPREIYKTQFFLVLSYTDFIQRNKDPQEFLLPNVWHNFHSTRPMEHEEDVAEVVKDLWVEFVDMNSNITWTGTVYLYAIPFEEEEDFHIVEQAIERLHYPGASRIEKLEFNLIFRALSRMIEIPIEKVQYFKKGQRVKFEVDNWLDWEEDDIVEVVNEESINRKPLTLDDLKLRNNQTVTVQSLETCAELGLPNYEYYNIKFDDGVEVTAISGMCLKKIKP